MERLFDILDLSESIANNGASNSEELLIQYFFRRIDFHAQRECRVVGNQLYCN